MKHSYACRHCKSVWLYYFPEKEEMTGDTYKTLKKGICINCKKKIANQKALDVRKIASMTILPMTFIKKDLWEYKIQGNKDIKERLKILRKKIPFKDFSFDLF